MDRPLTVPVYVAVTLACTTWNSIAVPCTVPLICSFVRQDEPVAEMPPERLSPFCCRLTTYSPPPTALSVRSHGPDQLPVRVFGAEPPEELEQPATPTSRTPAAISHPLLQYMALLDVGR
jgi:hypothetical protein